MLKTCAMFPNFSVTQESLLNQVLHLGLVRFSMNSELLDGIKFFQSKGLSGYDASYAALAKILKGKWVTFDGKAHKVIQRYGVSELLGSV